MMMKKCEVWKVVLFTASHGAVPSEIIDDDHEQVFKTTRDGPVPLTANLAAQNLNPQIHADFVSYLLCPVE